MTKASSGMKQVFARAVALYRRGKVAEAAKLFRKVAAAGGEVAARARRYLARITAESARTKTKGRSSRGTKLHGGKPFRGTVGRGAKGATPKVARPKAAKKAKAPGTDKKPFRREDIPGISPQLGDMVDPFGAAEQLGVDVRDLAAFLIRDGAKNVMLNDFYVAKKGKAQSAG